MNLHDYLPLAAQSMALWKKHADNLQPTKKSDDSAVTTLDTAVSNETRHWCAKTFSHHPPALLDEEASTSPSIDHVMSAETLILSDPVDWTSNLAAGGNRFTLANICHLKRRPTGSFVPTFAAALVPFRNALWYWELGKPVSCLDIDTLEPKNITLIPHSHRDPRCLVLGTKHEKKFFSSLEFHYQRIHGPSVESMIIALTHPVYALFFMAKPWDIVLFPLLLEQGFIPYNFATSQKIDAFRPENFWDSIEMSWGNSEYPIVFLTKDAPDPSGYLENLRKYLKSPLD